MTALSPRELEVLSCWAEGLTDRQTADRLTWSINTAKDYRDRIFRKLGARNRAHAIVIAFRAGILQ